MWVHGSRLSSLSLHCLSEIDTSLLCVWFWNGALGSLQHLWHWCYHIEVGHGYAVGVLDRQTHQGGTRGSRLCGEDRDRETENLKVCARTRDTRFIQVQAAKVASPTSCLGDQVWRPALGVG
jgi:hypothetical protein